MALTGTLSGSQTRRRQQSDQINDSVKNASSRTYVNLRSGATVLEAIQRE